MANINGSIKKGKPARLIINIDKDMHSAETIKQRININAFKVFLFMFHFILDPIQTIFCYLYSLFIFFFGNFIVFTRIPGLNSIIC